MWKSLGSQTHNCLSRFPRAPPPHGLLLSDHEIRAGARKPRETACVMQACREPGWDWRWSSETERNLPCSDYEFRVICNLQNLAVGQHIFISSCTRSHPWVWVLCSEELKPTPRVGVLPTNPAGNPPTLLYQAGTETKVVFAPDSAPTTRWMGLLGKG